MSEKKTLLGARIKELRKRSGLTQDQLAERIEVEAKYLSRIEVGKRYPSLDVLERIADSMKVEMKELFDYSHHDNAVITPAGITKAVDGATREEMKLIFKLIRAVRQ